MKVMILNAISSQAIEMIGDTVDRVGIASIMTTLGISVADQAGAIELASSLSETWGAFDWLSFLAVIGTITFIIKNIVSARKTYLEIQLLKIQKDDKE
jgi:hypothetical protein